jgi:SNF2 family DNA or RNA helicase
MDELRKADDQAVIYSDVLNYVDRENEIAEGRETEKKLLAKQGRGRDPLAGLLKTSLLSYQVRGAIFAACRGRVILADDMGLGKTVQALAATEFLRRSRGIQRVLIVAPASVKYSGRRKSKSSPAWTRRSSRVCCLNGTSSTLPQSFSISPATSWF